jgi:hypothetical protein
MQLVCSAEFVDAPHGPDGEFFQRIFEPSRRLDAVEYCRSEQALNCSGAFACTL